MTSEPSLSREAAPVGHGLAQALEQLRQAQATLDPGERALLTFAAPAGAAGELADLEPGLTRAVWAPEGSTWVALGEARRFRAEGAERFLQLQKQLEDWFATFRKNKDNSERPIAFGGGSFGHPRDARGPWLTFGEATFVAPAILYSEKGSEASLSVLVDREHDSGWLLKRAIEVLGREARPAQVSAEVVTLARPGRSDVAWSRLVEDATAAIRSGLFDKVVLARKLVLELSTRPKHSELLERLRQQGTSAARFLLQFGAQTFVGASPERLVRRQGRHLETEALAGTMPKGPGAAERLLSSEKECFEHKLVVQAIAEAMAPLCHSLHVPERPELAELPNLYHLRTPISAELCEQTSILELVSRLHPTPAVGGAPRESALQYIEEHEPMERGWYAAPFGWVDAEGDGEFIVALRSALLDGNTAHLYAGAGIVRDSDPEAEFQETEVKLARMWTALGLRAASQPSQAYESARPAESGRASESGRNSESSQGVNPNSRHAGQRP